MKSYIAALLFCLPTSTSLIATPAVDEKADTQPAKVMTMAEVAKESLRGVPGVRVYVGDFNNNSANHGLSMKQLQTDVELRLRQSGIKVFSEKEIQEVASSPYLSIQITTMPTLGKAMERVDIDVRFAQIVVTDINPNLRMLAPTWYNSMSYIFSEKELAKSIRDSVRDQVDSFCNDFLAVNPKK